MDDDLLELSDLAWRAGEHRGTLVGPRGLTLVQGVSRGVWEGTLAPARPWTRLVASLNPDPWPSGAGVRLSVRARLAGGVWTEWASLGQYGSSHGLPRSEAHPEAHGDAPSEGGALRVASDVLRVEAGPAHDLAVRLELEAGDLGGAPLVRRLALQPWTPAVTAEDLALPDSGAHPAWGRRIELTPRSQRTEPGDLALRGCSPTALAMLLAHHGLERTTAEVARGVYDHSARIYGNWSFNVAYAASCGLEATVVRLRSFAALEREVEAGRPAVITHRYALADAPREAALPATDGHLIVVAGFTAQGDVEVYDPAADPRRGEPVARVYGREELRRTWLLHPPGGIAYLARPAR